ncbi:MAG: nucleotidyltransferase domain-containing protein [Eubacteriaceae bacterium]|nr:nucleotidyltransferase domain-containing protein [Eubacteriaceae bacterium]
MNDKIYTLNEIQSAVEPIAKQFGLERIYLFGSYARGEATASSDIDFRVDKGNIKGFFVFAALYNALADAFDKPVDVVTTHDLDREFLAEIADEEVLLYAG